MLPWSSLILTLVKLAYAALDYAKNHRLLKAGEDRQIALQSVELLRRTDEGKILMERLDAMSVSERDALDDVLGKSFPR